MIEAILWQNIWFCLIVLAFALFSILDGFDLGAGIVFLFVSRSEEDRRAVMSALAPLWDGNEVWLIVGGGSIFAAFPAVFSAVLSGFYTAVFLVIVALMLRAAGFEFRSHSHRMRGVWDVLFSVGSFLVPVLLLVAVGNAIQGVALNPLRQYAGGLVGLLRPLPILMGVMGACVAAVHGLIFLSTKTDDALSKRCIAWAGRCGWIAIALVAAFAVSAVVVVPGSARGTATIIGFCSWAASFSLLMVFVHRHMVRSAFAASATAMASLWIAIAGLAYPWLVRSTESAIAGYSIVSDASSTAILRPLGILAIAVFVVAGLCIAFVYRVFRGKVGASDLY